MKKELFRTGAALLTLILLAACSSGRQRGNGLTGNDKDIHGCIGSAGYQWSALRKECIRPFEAGLKCSGAMENNAGYAAYLIFSPDSTRVEVFMAEIKNVPVLNKDVLSPEETVWTSDDPKAPVVRKTGQKWEILLDGNTAYSR